MRKLAPQRTIRLTMTKSFSHPYVDVIQEENSTQLYLFFPPVPASRPRVTRWGVYYGKNYKTWMETADQLLPDSKLQHEGPLKVNVKFVCTKPKMTKRLWPRGDGDNFEKAIYDAMTKKGYWKDDDQIVSGSWIKRFAKETETPHIEVTIIPYENFYC